MRILDRSNGGTVHASINRATNHGNCVAFLFENHEIRRGAARRLETDRCSLEWKLIMKQKEKKGKKKKLTLNAMLINTGASFNHRIKSNAASDGNSTSATINYTMGQKFFPIFFCFF